MLNLTEKGVDVLIKRSASDKLDPHWDSYNLIIWKHNKDGLYNKNGLYRKNSWGISEKFEITDNGTWKLPKKYVKYFK